MLLIQNARVVDPVSQTDEKLDLVIDQGKIAKILRPEETPDFIKTHEVKTEDVKGCIDKIRATGKKVGITIKPATPAEAVDPYLELVDMVLVMTVEPGFGGQKLIPECLDKVAVIRKMITDRGLTTDLEVDGGIHLDNVALALDAGANIIVAGSAVFKDDIAANAKAFLAKMQ